MTSRCYITSLPVCCCWCGGVASIEIQDSPVSASWGLGCRQAPWHFHLVLFGDRISLHFWVWPGTHYVASTGLRLSLILSEPVSAEVFGMNHQALFSIFISYSRLMVQSNPIWTQMDSQVSCDIKKNKKNVKVSNLSKLQVTTMNYWLADKRLHLPLNITKAQKSQQFSLKI